MREDERIAAPQAAPPGMGIDAAVFMAQPWFAALPPAVRTDILRHARPRHLADGATLFRRGDAVEGWYGVARGSVRLCSRSSDGREAVLGYLGPGAWFGEIALTDGRPSMLDAIACGTTVLACVPASPFFALIERHPPLGLALLRQQSRRTRLLIGALEAQATLPASMRLALHLYRLALTHGRREGDRVLIDLHLPQEALAQLAGMSRQLVNRELKQWERDALIAQRYGRLSLLDFGRLEAMIRTVDPEPAEVLGA